MEIAVDAGGVEKRWASEDGWEAYVDDNPRQAVQGVGGWIGVAGSHCF